MSIQFHALFWESIKHLFYELRHIGSKVVFHEWAGLSLSLVLSECWAELKEILAVNPGVDLKNFKCSLNQNSQIKACRERNEFVINFGHRSAILQFCNILQ